MILVLLDPKSGNYQNDNFFFTFIFLPPSYDICISPKNKDFKSIKKNSAVKLNIPQGLVAFLLEPDTYSLPDSKFSLNFIFLSSSIVFGIHFIVYISPNRAKKNISVITKAMKRMMQEKEMSFIYKTITMAISLLIGNDACNLHRCTNVWDNYGNKIFDWNLVESLDEQNWSGTFKMIFVMKLAKFTVPAGDAIGNLIINFAKKLTANGEIFVLKLVHLWLISHLQTN